jgi:hypothetical protein
MSLLEKASIDLAGTMMMNDGKEETSLECDARNALRKHQVVAARENALDVFETQSLVSVPFSFVFCVSHARTSILSHSSSFHHGGTFGSTASVISYGCLPKRLPYRHQRANILYKLSIAFHLCLKTDQVTIITRCNNEEGGYFDVECGNTHSSSSSWFIRYNHFFYYQTTSNNITIRSKPILARLIHPNGLIDSLRKITAHDVASVRQPLSHKSRMRVHF